jgi:DNA-binding response OmpR family regulator
LGQSGVIPSAQRATILIVDDDAELRSALRIVLEQAGYHVAEAEHGEQALHLMVDATNRLEPWLVILDMRMPFMSGWEFLAVMKSYVRLAQTPVLVLSARPPNLDAIAHGVIAAWIEKPYEVVELLALVKTHARPSNARSIGHTA